MSSGPPKEQSQDRLQSWKDIALYLSCSISTARRWEKEKRLPIRHDQGSEWTYKSELDAWFKSRDTGPDMFAELDANTRSSEPDSGHPRRRFAEGDRALG